MRHTITLLAALLLALPAALRADSSAVGGAESASAPSKQGVIPIRFTLKEPGSVTLVIEDSSGRRVRNLVSGVACPAGENTVWWDGLDDLGRNPDAARHGVYEIPARFVAPGSYRVRGLVAPPVHLRYEFSVYNPGRPAWETEDGRGGWLANHTPPSAVLFVPEADAARGPASPSPGGCVLVGSYVAEGGAGLAWLDLEGRKRYGQMWLGGVWTGAPYLARDAGPKRTPGVYGYAASAWEGGGYDGPKPELRLAELLTREVRAAAPRDGRFGKGWDRPLLRPNAPYQGILPPGQQTVAAADTRYTFPDNAHMGVSGIAVYNARLAASLTKMNQLLWVNTSSRKILGATDLPDPRGVAFDASGRLFALSGTRLVRFDAGGYPVGAPQTVVAAGLEDPQGITIDSAGLVYVSDWGSSHNVKVFSPDGRLVRSIGQPGAPAAGTYNPQHMNHPRGLTVDGQGRLWVAEEDFQPRRVSVWTTTGQLVRAFYGSSEYGGGGRLDPRDRNRFYYNGMEFALDWKQGADRLVRVFHRPGPGDLAMPDGYGGGGPPETPLYADGRQYMTNCYNSNPTNGASIALLWLMGREKAVPVAAFGRASDWKLLNSDAMKPRWPAGMDLNAGSTRGQVMFAWSDLNGDAHIDPDEVTFWKGAGGGVTVMPDLSILESRVDDRAMRYRPVRFTRAGVPVYDPARGETLLPGAQPPTSSGGDQALLSPDGWTVLTVAPKPFAPQSIGGGRNGQATWSYPSLWPGLHASHEAPRSDRPGEIIGTTRLLGGPIPLRKGEAGAVWSINGNMGNMYLFTADGLFVSELFRDIRIGKSWTMPESRRGMLLDDVSLHDENFWPTITQTSDGNVYLVDGARTSIVRVDGLDGIRRLPATPLKVTAEDLRRAEDWNLQQEAARQRNRAGDTLHVALRDTAPTVDGKLDDWAGANWVTIDKRGVAANFNSNSKPYDATAALAVSGGRLYAAFRTGDTDLLRNAGDASAPFKTGGALDLMLRTDPAADPARRSPAPGDIRLLVTRAGGKTLAVLYRAVVPGATNPVLFSSPWRTIPIDRVDDVSGSVELVGADGNYEFSIPLDVLGLKPAPGLKTRGDVGVLRGNGFQTLQRVYWHNKATAITSDVPSEAELTPALWGELVFGP